jgi:hypothetical protein
MIALYILMFFFGFQDAPYKPKEEFEAKLNFEFRQRPHDPNLHTFEGNASPPQPTGPLPYLKINLKLLKLSPEEIKLKILNFKGEIVISRKAAEGQVVELDLGFTDDLKGHVSSHEYVALLLDKEKKAVSRIVIRFEEDGSYLINGEKRGKI